MSDQKKLQIAEISNELWGDNLWYRKLDQEGKDAVALTVYLMRNPGYIKAPSKFAEVIRGEITNMIDAWKSR